MWIGCEPVGRDPTKKRSGYEIRQKYPRIRISGTQKDCAAAAKSPNFWTFIGGHDHIYSHMLYQLSYAELSSLNALQGAPGLAAA